jgi:hypothetical protein
MYYDRVYFTTATTGTGTITAGAAVSVDYRTLASVPDGEEVGYTITDGNAWETGFGIVGGDGTTMTRPLSGLSASSTGALLNLTGDAEVLLTPIAEQMNQLTEAASRGLQDTFMLMGA